MYRKNNYSHHRDNNREMNHHYVKPRKSLILLKSTVFVLFVVLVVSVAFFEIFKSYKEEKMIAAKCDKVAQIKLSSAIEKIEEYKDVLVILTKISNNKQQIIRLDAACGKELSRIEVVVE